MSDRKHELAGLVALDTFNACDHRRWCPFGSVVPGFGTAAGLGGGVLTSPIGCSVGFGYADEWYTGRGTGGSRPSSFFRFEPDLNKPTTSISKTTAAAS